MVKQKTKFIIIISTLVLAITGLIIALTVVIEDKRNAQTRLESVYEKSYYEMLDSLQNLQVKLDKACISQSVENSALILNEISRVADTFTNNLSILPLPQEVMFQTARFSNQTADYCAYLARQAIMQEQIPADCNERLGSLKQVAEKLYEEYRTFSQNIGAKFNFAKIGLKNYNDNMFASMMQSQGEQVIDYPSMIYDGAFSDGAKGRDGKFLNGKTEVTEGEAQTKVEKYLRNYKITSIKALGVTDAENVKSYAFAINTKSGEMFAQVSMRGGYLVMLDYSKNFGEVKVSEEQSIRIAEAFAKDIGFAGMQAVWVSYGNEQAYINLAYVSDDIIYYKDFIKVKIALDTGEIMGVESANYLHNHTGATVDKRNIDISKARESLHEEFGLESIRLAVIPKGNSSERLAIECFGNLNGDEYFIYLDATTYKEVEIFKVVGSGKDGRLVE